MKKGVGQIFISILFLIIGIILTFTMIPSLITLLNLHGVKVNILVTLIDDTLNVSDCILQIVLYSAISFFFYVLGVIKLIKAIKEYRHSIELY